jgi:protein O-GlcNAc transferase
MVDSPASPQDKNLHANPLAVALAHRQAGRYAEAAVLFRGALERDGKNATLLLHYAETMYRLGSHFAAHDALKQAADIDPDNIDAIVLLGRVLTALGQPREAVVAFRRAIAKAPAAAIAWRLMAPALYAIGSRESATGAFDYSDHLQPVTAADYNALGAHLLGERRALEAEAAFRRAIKYEPEDGTLYQNLATALAFQDRLGEAVDIMRRGTELTPDAVGVWNMLTVFENAAGHYDQARAAAGRAIALRPSSPDSLTNLAGIRLEEGDAASALTLLEAVLDVMPGHRSAGDTYLLARHYIDSNPKETLQSALGIGAHLSRGIADASGFDNSRDPERRLRIGYVSADFHRHSCASFLRALLPSHDPRAIEVVAYSDNIADDEITTELQRGTAAWRRISGLNDAAAAELIRGDRIDILVDLAGHTSGNRLSVFARKPAPIQVSWLGYPGTTGIAEIDYRITDGTADPPEQTDGCYSEALWRLPGCFLAFAPDPSSPEPAERTGLGGPLFGSFNHLPKITPDVVAVWSRILHAVPSAQLLLKARRLGETATQARYAALFAQHGITPERLEFAPWQADAAAHLDLYRRVDLALDPFPYNGTTTTCEALWMGVPVLTLAGAQHAGRVGASLLQTVGMSELVATSADDYVSRAISLATDAGRLDGLRKDLRERMRKSPLCDGREFARRFETALREMWRAWCRKEGPR